MKLLSNLTKKYNINAKISSPQDANEVSRIENLPPAKLTPADLKAGIKVGVCDPILVVLDPEYPLDTRKLAFRLAKLSADDLLHKHLLVLPKRGYYSSQMYSDEEERKKILKPLIGDPVFEALLLKASLDGELWGAVLAASGFQSKWAYKILGKLLKKNPGGAYSLLVDGSNLEDEVLMSAALDFGTEADLLKFLGTRNFDENSDTWDYTTSLVDSLEDEAGLKKLAKEAKNGIIRHEAEQQLRRLARMK